jgi:hypothetical protein
LPTIAKNICIENWKQINGLSHFFNLKGSVRKRNVNGSVLSIDTLVALPWDLGPSPIAKFTGLAEGVVSAPFLPSDDQGHKVRFATLQFKQSNAWQVAHGSAVKFGFNARSIGWKVKNQPWHAQKLGTWPDKAKS